MCYADPMSTYETEFGLNEEVSIKPMASGKRGIIREIILSSNGKNPTQEYGVEAIGTKSYDLSHFSRGQLQTLS